MADVPTGNAYNPIITAQQYPTAMLSSGTPGTSDVSGTAEPIRWSGNPATGAGYVEIVNAASVGGGSNVNVVTGTQQTLGTVGTVLGVGNIGTLGSVVSVAQVHNAGTIQSGSLTNLASLHGGTVNVGTFVNNGGFIGTLNSGTVQLDPTPVPATLTFGTLGTAGGSFFGTISSASGAGTRHFVTGVDIVAQSGTADVRVLAGTAIQGTGVLAAGFFPSPGGGISNRFTPAFVTGTNSELTYHFVGAGTAFIRVSYWKGV